MGKDTPSTTSTTMMTLGSAATATADQERQAFAKGECGECLRRINSDLAGDPPHVAFQNLLSLVGCYKELSRCDKKLGQIPPFDEDALNHLTDYLNGIKFFIFNTPGLTPQMQSALGVQVASLTKGLMLLYDTYPDLSVSSTQADTLREIAESSARCIEGFIEQGKRILQPILQLTDSESELVRERWTAIDDWGKVLGGILIVGFVAAALGSFAGLPMGIVLSAGKMAAADAIMGQSMGMGAIIGGVVGVIIGARTMRQGVDAKHEALQGWKEHKGKVTTRFSEIEEKEPESFKRALKNREIKR